MVTRKEAEELLLSKQNLYDLTNSKLCQYVGENCYSSDGDGDWVEFIENHEECWEMQHELDELTLEIEIIKDWIDNSKGDI